MSKATFKKIDYKKELESASRGMIMVHDPSLLIKLIIRLIVRKVHAKHAGILLLDPEKGHYVLTISGGEAGMKIPPGFAKFSKDNPLIRLFTQKEYQAKFFKKGYLVVSDLNDLLWKESTDLREYIFSPGPMIPLFGPILDIVLLNLSRSNAPTATTPALEAGPTSPIYSPVFPLATAMNTSFSWA